MKNLEAIWNARLDEYNAAAKAYDDFYRGEFNDVMDAHDAATDRLKETFGNLDLARANAVGRATFNETWKASERAEAQLEELGDVQLRALYALMMTPAPDRAALCLKIDLMHNREVGQLTTKPEDPLIVVRRDVEALLLAA